jgi:hypothetical protein
MNWLLFFFNCGLLQGFLLGLIFGVLIGISLFPITKRGEK